MVKEIMLYKYDPVYVTDHSLNVWSDRSYLNKVISLIILTLNCCKVALAARSCLQEYTLYL